MNECMSWLVIECMGKRIMSILMKERVSTELLISRGEITISVVENYASLILGWRLVNGRERHDKRERGLPGKFYQKTWIGGKADSLE